jgi:adenylate cyclase
VIEAKGLADDLSRFLPAPLMARLPERSALREAIQHLNSLQRAVVSYLPLYIAEDEDLLSRDQYANLRAGAFLFADVSGFTALSERLQQRSGAEGTETLTSVINEYFSTMLEVLAKSDGQLLKFAGDALLAFWVGGSDRETLTACRKAIRTGLRMQRAMKEKFQPIQHEQIRQVFGADHQSQLTMSIGIARGKLMEALVGNAQQRDHIIMGQLPGDAMEAEGVGERDEVIVNTELANDVKDEFPTQTELEAGYLQIVDDFGDQLDDYELEMPLRRRAKTTALFDLEQANLMAQLQTVAEKVKNVSRYVPPPVLHELIVSEDYHLTSENRLTVTMFVHCTGFAELLQDWGEAHFNLAAPLLRRYYNIAQQIVSAHGGTLARTDPYKLGTKLLITFGAPISHTDDPERAVTAGLELNYQLAQFNARIAEELPPHLRRESYIRQRIGITQGETYAGEVGWKQRREFTVMGDDVNLSARLMAKAEYGQVLISSQVYRRVIQFCEVEPLEALSLKGKSEPVPVFAVKRAASLFGGRNLDKDMPFVGHDMFMLSLGMTLKQAAMGRRRAVALVGDAGIGKTRIANQLADVADNAGFRVAWAACQARSTHRTTWATLVAQLLDIDPANEEEGQQKLAAWLAERGLTQIDPTLSDLLFGVKPPSNSNRAAAPTAAAPAQENAQRVNDLFRRFQQMSLEERKTSGMFGVARRRATQSDPNVSPIETSGVWKQAERRTSLKDSLAQMLQAYTAKQPTLLVIDDLHQENPQALELLKHILEQVTQAKLVVLVTYEPGASLDMGVQTLVVPDLSRDETTLVAMALLRASELGPRLGHLLWERTSGRPLFIESLLRTLLDDGYIEDVNGRAELKADADLGALPDNVRALVISRIDRLSAEMKHLLNAAAVLDEAFTMEELDAVAELADREDVKSLLPELVKMQLLAEREKGNFAFRHGMTQTVIYETLSRAQRLKLHRLATQYWRSRTGADARPSTLAYHLVKTGLLPEAIEIITKAAEEAEQKRDIDGAVELYSHALTIFPDEKSISTQLERLRRLQSGE